MLTNREVINYRIELQKITRIQPMIYINETFEFINVSKSDAERIKRILNTVKFVSDVYIIESKKYNFNKYNFNKGYPEPEKYYNVKGKIIKKLEETLDINDKLNDKIWSEDKKLIKEVEEKILEIVDLFKEELKQNEVELKIDDIYILGSNANYNYNKDSDLDVHIIADESFDCKDEHLQKIYDAYKKIFNDKYDITIKGINVELYVEKKDNISNVSNGVYSLTKGWIKDPDKYEIPEIDAQKYEELKKEWEIKYFEVLDSKDLDKIDSFFDDIYDTRKDSLSKEGEFGLGNLVFKHIRRLGYLSDLRKIKDDLISQSLSLE